jgi:DNA invertase Pin-like site-specific DNA recombinase
VKFHSLTEAIDSATPTGRAMWQMIGVLAELERSLISECTHAGVKAAQHRGVRFGPKPKLTAEQIDHARKLIDKGEARQYVADLLNVGCSTLYRALSSGASERYGVRGRTVSAHPDHSNDSVHPEQPEDPGDDKSTAPAVP